MRSARFLDEEEDHWVSFMEMWNSVHGFLQEQTTEKSTMFRGDGPIECRIKFRLRHSDSVISSRRKQVNGERSIKSTYGSWGMRNCTTHPQPFPVNTFTPILEIIG